MKSFFLVAFAAPDRACVIHHTGKDASKGARGSSVINGNFDTLFQLSEDEEPLQLTLSAGKQKNDEKAAIHIRLEVVVCGMNGDGEVVKSLAVSEDSGDSVFETSALGNSKAANPTPYAEMVLRVLEEAGPNGLDELAWRKAAQEAGVGRKRPATAREIINKLKAGNSVRAIENGNFVRV